MPNHEPNPEALRRLKAAAYDQGAAFGSFPAFFGVVDAERGAIRDDYQRLYPWRSTLLKADLARLQVAFEHRQFRSVLDAFHSTGRPEQVFDEIAGVTAAVFGLDERPSLHLVDQFPEAFESRPWDAASVDLQDAARFGISAGIYFRRRSSTHYYFEFVIAHEVVHWVISQFSSDDHLFTAPIEEGVCDIVALEVLARYGMSETALSNLLVYNRALQTAPPWCTYWQALRNVASFVLADGFDALLSVIRRGRESVNALAGGSVVRRHSVALAPSLAAVENAASVIPLDVDAFVVLAVALDSRARGVVTVADLEGACRMPPEVFDAALGKLESSGWVTRHGEAQVFVPHESTPPYIRYML